MDILHTLATYMPIDRRHAVAAGQELPDRTAGVALFADVSGFTALTGVLMQELGPQRGAEEVLVYLNPLFDGLIGQLHRYGGVVIGFAGDSITCWLDGDDGSRALAAALAMQEVMKPYRSMVTAQGTRFSLSIKVALAAGPVRRFVVGCPDIQRVDVLAGDTLRRMAACEQLAERGETAVEAPILEWLGERVTVSGWRSAEGGLRVGLVTALSGAVKPVPWSPLAAGALQPEQVRPWLLPPVHARIRAGQDFLAELRPAVALFMRFSGLHFDQDDQVGVKMDAFVSWVQQVVQRYDGYLIQLTVGDKGSFLYVAFGAPIAHDDNAVRAVAAALDLQARATTFEGIAEIQIAISAGRMWTGAYGASQRRTYGVMGHETNMAARLMARAAPNQILVTAQVVAATRSAYYFRDLGTVTVKGRSEPLPVWEVVGRQLRAAGEWSLLSGPLVRRERLQAELSAILADVTAGNGRVVRLVGSAGSGKSHLAAHFSQEATAQGVQLLLGACQSIDQGAAYHAWRQILGGLLGIGDLEEAAAAGRLSALAEAEPTWALRLPLLGDLLQLPLADNATTAVLDASTRQKTLFSLVAEILQRYARRRPLLLVIENAHWLDEACLDLSHFLARQTVPELPILLLLIHRRGKTGQTADFSQLAALAHAVTVEVAELADEDAAALIAHRLDAPPARLLLSIIQTIAQGVPFFINELLDAMCLSEQLRQGEEGSWQVSDEIVGTLRAADMLTGDGGLLDLRPNSDLSEVDIRVPDSIHAIVLSRLDRLPEEHKLTLKVSSVIGYYFDLPLLAQAHPQEKDVATLQAEAQAMEAEEVVHEEEPECTTYTFRQHTTQEVAYETLLFSQRQQLHRSVAEALAESAPYAVTQIAHHAYLGQAWPLSLRYNLAAGEQAMRLYANRQSIEFFQRALESAGHLPEEETGTERMRISSALGELLVSTGQYEAAAEQLATALALAETAGDRQTAAHAYLWYGRSHELRGEYTAALEWLDRGVARLDGQTFGEAGELLLITGLVHFRQGEYERTLELCERSMQVADTIQDNGVRARTYNLMGYVDLRRGDGGAALNRFRLALAHYEALENVYGQATTHNLMAIGLRYQGDWSGAEQHYRQALALFEQMGDYYNQVGVRNNLGEIARKQGRLEAALGHYERAVRLLEQSGGSRWLLGLLQMNIGHTHLRGGELAAAQGRLLMAESHFEQTEMRDMLPELYALFAQLALAEGQLEQASARGERALGLAREFKMAREEGQVLRVLGETALALGQHREAEELLQESYRILSESGDEYEGARTQLSLTGLFGRLAQRARAEAALTEAEVVFHRLGARLDGERAAALRQSWAVPE